MKCSIWGWEQREAHKNWVAEVRPPNMNKERIKTGWKTLWSIETTTNKSCIFYDDVIDVIDVEDVGNVFRVLFLCGLLSLSPLILIVFGFLSNVSLSPWKLWPKRTNLPSGEIFSKTLFIHSLFSWCTYYPCKPMKPLLLNRLLDLPFCPGIYNISPFTWNAVNLNRYCGATLFAAETKTTNLFPNKRTKRTFCTSFNLN